MANLFRVLSYYFGGCIFVFGIRGFMKLAPKVWSLGLRLFVFICWQRGSLISFSMPVFPSICDPRALNRKPRYLRPRWVKTKCFFLKQP